MLKQDNSEYIMQGSLGDFGLLDSIDKIKIRTRKSFKNTRKRIVKQPNNIIRSYEIPGTFQTELPDYLKDIEYIGHEGGENMYIDDDSNEINGFGNLGKKMKLWQIAAILGTLFIGGAVYHQQYKKSIALKEAEAVTPDQKKQVNEVKAVVETYGPPAPTKTEAEKLRLKSKSEAILSKVAASTGTFVTDMAPVLAPVVVSELEKQGISPYTATQKEVYDIINPPFYKKYMWWLIGGGFSVLLVTGIFLKQKQKGK